MTVDPTTLASKPTEAWFEDTWWWKIKLRLQWSGWLQYIPNLVATLLMLLLAGIGALIGVWPWLLVGLPLILAALLFANFLLDVTTVRFGLHPEEALPKPRDDLDAFDLMRSRVSCRSFQKRDLTDAHRERVLELAQTYSRPENCIGAHPIRLEYLAAPLTVWPVVRGTEFLVAVAERAYHEEAVVDIGHSLQKVVLDATRMGLATCWIGPGADPSSIASHLGPRFDPERDHVICVCAIGYASRYKPLSLRLMQRSQKWRTAVNELFFAGTECADAIDPAAVAYAEFGRCFEGCQWSPSSYNAQPTRGAAVVEDGKLVRIDFCAATKSRYYAMVALGIWLANWEYGCRAQGIDGHVAKVSTIDEHRPDLPRYVISWLRGA
jgi:nitroreductase